MNKKIKELAELSHLQPYYDAQEIAIEMFAKLLIEECVYVCSQQRDPTTLNYKPSEKFVDAIRLHFK